MTQDATAVATEALRRIRVIASNETPATVDLTYTEAQWDYLFAELAEEPGVFGFAWTVDTVPDSLFRPIAWLLAVQIAPHYSRENEGYRAALMRLRRIVKVDDRANYRDYDEDGIVDESEENAAKRAVYY